MVGIGKWGCWRGGVEERGYLYMGEGEMVRGG